ncbi:HAD family hydrolase [Desulfurococcus amylolyticus]|uniref:HAD family hydrolase n=1 Tax=Desulfurococcus amylolyticus TaxID=94694 RepID=UPI000ABC6625|nr:HAD family hydrolase [Desulfurococcus amylolyticus]
MYMVKLVSFDLWDTLIFDEGVEPESYTLKRLEAIWKSIPSDKKPGFNNVLEAYRVVKHVKGFIKPEDFVKAILLVLGLDIGWQAMRQAIDAYEEASGSYMPRVDPDARDVLKTLKENGLKTMIVSDTSFSGSSVKKMLSNVGLGEYVDLVITSADTGFLKPNPRIFKVGLEKLTVNPWEAIHVGDSCSRDVIGALLTGLRPVLLARRMESVENCGKTGVTVISRLKELMDLIGFKL